MNPNPFSALNHLTVPSAMTSPCLTRTGAVARRADQVSRRQPWHVQDGHGQFDDRVPVLSGFLARGRPADRLHLRRRAASAGIRVSWFQNGVAAVHRSVEEREPDLPNTGPSADATWTSTFPWGSVGPVRRDLRFHPDPREFSVPPGPLRWSGALDLSLVSRPACAITGRIGIARVEFRLTEQPAMTCLYWGRNLPAQWVWLSGNDFDWPGTGIEIGLIRSSLWGASVPLP